MPTFMAKRDCFYNGRLYEEGQTAEFYEEVSARSWEAMDSEAQALLMYPEESKPKREEASDTQNSGTALADLQEQYNALLGDFAQQQNRIIALEGERDTALQSVTELRLENDALVKSAEAATILQGKVADLKQMVKDNENKSVLEKAINGL